jgi:hypothetical protein
VKTKRKPPIPLSSPPVSANLTPITNPPKKQRTSGLPDHSSTTNVQQPFSPSARKWSNTSTPSTTTKSPSISRNSIKRWWRIPYSPSSSKSQPKSKTHGPPTIPCNPSSSTTTGNPSPNYPIATTSPIPSYRSSLIPILPPSVSNNGINFLHGIILPKNRNKSNQSPYKNVSISSNKSNNSKPAINGTAPNARPTASQPNRYQSTRSHRSSCCIWSVSRTNATPKSRRMPHMSPFPSPLTWGSTWPIPSPCSATLMS